MKLGAEPTCFRSSLSYGPAHKTFDYSRNRVESEVLKIANELTEEGKHELTSILGRGSNEMEKDPLSTKSCDINGPGKALRPYNYILDNSVSETENKSCSMATSYSAPVSDRKNKENGTVFCTNMTVEGIKLPEVVVCFRDRNCNDKDICVDEGVRSIDKTSTKNGEVDFGVVGFSYSDSVEGGDLTKEMMGCALLPPSGGLKCSDFHCKSFNSSDKEVHNPSSSGKFLEDVQGDVVATEEIVDNIPDEKLKPKNLMLLESAGCVSDHLISIGSDNQLISGDKNKKLVIQGSHEMSTEGKMNVDATGKTADGVMRENVTRQKLFSVQELDMGEGNYDRSSFSGIDQQKSNQGHLSDLMDNVIARPLDSSEKTKLATIDMPSIVGFSNNRNKTNDSSFDRRVENGSITFNFISSVSAMTIRAESTENVDCRQSAHGLGHEDGGRESVTGSSRSFFIQHGHGEHDFTGMYSMSGPIAHSGSIPFSGSISLRSESSTASSRSFAFPILQSEWNSSPVRMAKPNRKQLRKRKCWSIPCFSCKF